MQRGERRVVWGELPTTEWSHSLILAATPPDSTSPGPPPSDALFLDGQPQHDWPSTANGRQSARCRHTVHTQHQTQPRSAEATKRTRVHARMLSSYRDKKPSWANYKRHFCLSQYSGANNFGKWKITPPQPIIMRSSFCCKFYMSCKFWSLASQTAYDT